MTRIGPGGSTPLGRRIARARGLPALAIAVGVVLQGGAARALQGPSPGAASASTLKVPDGPASVRGLADPATVDVFTGQVGYSVPIDLPAGPGGLGPKLSLNYSGSTGNGPLGLGWAIGEIAIRRSDRLGVPSYDDVFDELELVGVGGGGRLVRDPDHHEQFWVEGQGKSTKVVRKNAHFEVTDAGGVRYVLGTSSASREEDAGRVLSWKVDWIRDLSGNEVDYAYVKLKNRLYLETVTWGPKQSGASVFRLTIEYETRPDSTISYRSGFAISTDYRAKAIRVRSFQHELRAYHLTYDRAFSLSRLKRVEMTGLDGAGALPALTFTYGGVRSPDLKPMANAGGWVLNERGVSLFDVDGDGQSDLLRLEAGNHGYRQARGNEYAETKPLTGASDVDLESSTLMDLDGDARPELVRIVDDTWRAYRLEGTQWVSMGEWAGTRGVSLRAPDSILVDLNGDGRTDVVRSRGGPISVAFGGPRGLGPFIPKPAISPANVEVEPGLADVRFSDINGDGLADVVWLTDQWMKIFLGRGDGTFVAFTRSPYPWSDSAVNVGNVLLADLNRDGLVDLIRIEAGKVTWYRGETDGRFGTAFFRSAPRPESVDADAVVTTADVNGNGSTDVVWSSPRGLWAIDVAGETSAAMLSTIENGLGMSQSFSYSSSAALAVAAARGGDPWDKLLPTSVPVPVRTEIDLGDGSPLRVVERSVRDGFWDGTERRFGGFLLGRIVTVGASQSTSLVTETRFHPGLGGERELRGKTVSFRTSSAAGVLFSVETTTWEAIPVGGLPDVPLLRKAALRKSRSLAYEGASTPIEIGVDNEFDDQVRLTVERHQGRTDRAGDETVTRRTFQDDNTTNVRDKVTLEQVEEANARIVSATRTIYGAPSGPVLSFNQVGQGFVRKIQGYLSPGDRWVDQSTTDYDAHGNPTRIYKGGVERTLVYDVRSLHPLTETITRQPNETPLVWSMVWDDVRGAPLTITDPNGDYSHVSYDDVGRLQSVFLNNTEFPHTRYAYDWTAPRPKTTVSIFDGVPSELPGNPWPSGSKWRSTTTVANSAGEGLFSVRALGAQYIVDNWKERDERGNVVRIADGFYSSIPAPVMPVERTRIQTMQYDALGRLVSQTLPNGSTKTVTFAPLRQTVTAPELAPVTSELDGLQRIVRTERQIGMVLETVDASYDAAGRILSMSLQGGEVVHGFVYDTLGRMTHAEDPDTGPRDLVYDDANFLIQHTNGERQTVYFGYDDAGRLSRRGETLNPDPATDYTYVYDLASAGMSSGCHVSSRLAAVTEPSGEIHFCYDALGRQMGMERKIGLPMIGTKTGAVTATMTLSGLVLTESHDDGFATENRYDPAGRLIAISSGGADLWSADHPDDLDGAGRIVHERYGNGVKQDYSYDDLGLTDHTKVTPMSSSGSLFEVSVVRNAYGAPTMVTDLDHQGLDHTATFSYDPAARLETSTLGAAGPDQFAFTFAYDALQNMTTRTVTGPKDIGALTGTYQYGERGYGPRQLTSVIPGGAP